MGRSAGNTAALAARFMKLVFTRLAHGDHKHRAWLKKECVQLEAALCDALCDATGGGGSRAGRAAPKTVRPRR